MTRLLRPTVTGPAADVLVVVLLLGAIWVWASTPAYAQTQVVASDPPNGAVLAAPPQAITLTFTELTGALPLITVYDPDGVPLSTDPLKLEWPDSLRVPLTALTKPGRYTIHYRTLSGGISGILWFTLSGLPGAAGPASEQTPEAAAADPDPAEEQGPSWPWIVVGLAAVGAGVAGLIGVRREIRWW